VHVVKDRISLAPRQQRALTYHKASKEAHENRRDVRERGRVAEKEDARGGDRKLVQSAHHTLYHGARRLINTTDQVEEQRVGERTKVVDDVVRTVHAVQ
jgi:hypothetical protein